MNKEGYTLVELLAVIMILGIIALIAIPTVSILIEDSKKKAAEVSALHYLKAIEDQNALAKLLPEKYTPITSGDVNEINVNIKGDLPKEGTVTIENGKVTGLTACIGGYNVTYDGSKTTVGSRCGSASEPQLTFNGTFVAPEEGETHKGIVYVNPTDLEVECDQNNSTIGIGPVNSSGCLKFYVYNTEGSNYKMILDHDLSETKWNSTSTAVSEGMKEVKTTLESDTNGWLGNPRLIGADEIAHLVGADREDTIKWSLSKQYTYYASENTDINTYFYQFSLDGSGTTYSSSDGWYKRLSSSDVSKYAWLYNYVGNCENYGCNYNGKYPDFASFYWTSTPVYETGILVMHSFGQVYCVTPTSYGYIRPVIELPKSLFN